MNPVFALDLSGTTIYETSEHNLIAAVQALGGQVGGAQRVFPGLFKKLTDNVNPLPEPDFWLVLRDFAKITGTPDDLRQNFLQHFDYRPGMQDTLAELQKMRLPTFLWTNIPNSWLDALHRQLGIEDLVSGIVNGRNQRWRKPEPGFYQGALDRYDLDADRVIYISAHEQNREAAKPFTAQQWPTLPPERIIHLARRLIQVDHTRSVGGVILEL